MSSSFDQQLLLLMRDWQLLRRSRQWMRSMLMIHIHSLPCQSLMLCQCMLLLPMLLLQCLPLLLLPILPRVLVLQLVLQLLHVPLLLLHSYTPAFLQRKRMHQGSMATDQLRQQTLLGNGDHKGLLRATHSRSMMKTFQKLHAHTPSANNLLMDSARKGI
jgi:hypothetical protein